MQSRTNQAGLTIFEFTDLHGNQCSLQKSSDSHMNDAVWLGIANPEINIKIAGEWKRIELPKEAVIHSRMILSQKLVKELLPLLEYFSEHGESTSS